MYNGHVFLWNYNTQGLVKSFEVSDQPVRASKGRLIFAVRGKTGFFRCLAVKRMNVTDAWGRREQLVAHTARHCL